MPAGACGAGVSGHKESGGQPSELWKTRRSYNREGLGKGMGKGKASGQKKNVEFIQEGT